MKYTWQLGVISFFLIAGSHGPLPAQSELSAHDKFISTLEKLKDFGAAYLCRRASALSDLVSLRAQQSTLCKDALIGSFAEVVCSPDNIEYYRNSPCHKYAQQMLEDQSREDNNKTKAKAILVRELEKLPKLSQQAVCRVLAPSASALVCPQQETISEDL
jgi:hypothetical protein